MTPGTPTEGGPQIDSRAHESTNTPPKAHHPDTANSPYVVTFHSYSESQTTGSHTRVFVLKLKHAARYKCGFFEKGSTCPPCWQMRKWRIRMRRHRMTACDIRLTYAPKELFESALAAAGRDYVPLARPEGDRPT
jgi:hypothetical protein